MDVSSAQPGSGHPGSRTQTDPHAHARATHSSWPPQPPCRPAASPCTPPGRGLRGELGLRVTTKDLCPSRVLVGPGHRLEPQASSLPPLLPWRVLAVSPPFPLGAHLPGRTQISAGPTHRARSVWVGLRAAGCGNSRGHRALCWAPPDRGARQLGNGYKITNFSQPWVLLISHQEMELVVSIDV